ncbi:membrane hypothetical protein [Frigoribacterium sp. 9N]|nr:membrane hypothetical protein [Frigoribacterium sp. 9N]
MTLAMEAQRTTLATHNKTQTTHAAKATPVARRIHANSRSYQMVVVSLILIVSGCALAVSFNSQMAVGEWMLLGFASFLVPCSIDALIVCLSLTIPVLKAMGRKTRGAYATLFALIGITCALNVVHILGPALEADAVDFKVIVASTVYGFMPLLVFVGLHQFIELFFATPTASQRTLAARQSAIDAGLDPAEVSNSSVKGQSATTLDKPAPTTKATTRLTDEMRTEIHTLFTTKTLSVPEIAKRVGTSAPTARKVLKDAGLYEGKEAS